MYLNKYNWVGWRLVDLVVAVLLVAAVAKLADVPAFARALLTWKYIPRPAVMPLAYGVPLAELCLALLWFLRLGRRTAVLGSGACFGRVFRETRPATSGGREAPEVGPEGVRSARAFTLLEMIVVIALITLLISLLAPALAGVRGRAKEVRTLANLRSHATNMAAYTGQWNDVFPFMTDPDLDTTRIVVNGRDYDVWYWGATIVWPLGLLEAYYDGNMGHASLIEAEKDVAQPWGMWAYVYSSSFLARPEFWNPSTREGAHQLGPTKLTEVRYPDRKGIIVPGQDFAPADFETRFMGRARWRVGFVDTSARAVAQSELLPGYRTGEYPFGSGSDMVGFPVTHTIDGVRGRDVR